MNITQIVHLKRYEDLQITNKNGKGPIALLNYVSKEEFRPILRKLFLSKKEDDKLLVIRKCDLYGVAILPDKRKYKVLDVRNNDSQREPIKSSCQ